MHIFKNPHFDFLRWRWHALALSWIIIIAGLVVIMTKGIPLGIEFEGGTAVVAKFEREASIGQVANALDPVFGRENVTIQNWGDPSSHQVLMRVPDVGAEAGNSLGAVVDKVTGALKQANLGPFEVVYKEAVGPAVGQELRTKGISATVLSLLGILLYITFRYQFSFAIGAVVATIHDLLVTFAFLAFFQYDLSLNVIAALLTVAGYSSNDTIVIFDRVRENLRSMRRDSLNEVINVSVNQTLGRTIITAGTALLSAVALFLFGGEVLRGFAFTLIVGIMTGTYSTVFIAVAIVTIWRRKGPTRAANAPASTSPQQPMRKSKPQRKARAS